MTISRLTDSALQSIRDELGVPRTVTYLYSDNRHAWFGRAEDRVPLVWVDLTVWRLDGRPAEMVWDILPA